MSTALRRAIPQPVRTFVRRTVEAVRHPLHGHRDSRGDPPCAPLVGMTSADEQRFYEECVADVAGIEGVVVDLGCWMCSTTIPLARGVRRVAELTDTPSDKVFAFDRFIWQAWMDRYMPRLHCDYVPGESFLPEARRALADVREDVELVQVDLTKYVWKDGPIKILLVDAMKNAQLAQTITERFFPYLVKGALVIHQDFKHYYTPWIHVLQYRLRDHFHFHYEVGNGGTVAFETVQQVPHDLAKSAAQCEHISNDEVNAAFKYSLGLVGRTGKSGVAAAHVMHYVHKEQVHLAQQTLDTYAHFSHPPKGNFCTATERVREMAGTNRAVASDASDVDVDANPSGESPTRSLCPYKKICYTTDEPDELNR